jgi:hypothetical protein
MTHHLKQLGDQIINVALPTDESGYLGRECPNTDCKGYFKIVPGTGLSGVTNCHCPYCGHKADHSEFHTLDQIEYVKSIAIRSIEDALIKDLKSTEFDIKPKGPFGIGLSMKVKTGQPHPIHWYREQALETYLQCFNCTLKYAVFGVFAFCPDCKQHNSLHILDKNLELVVKMLNMTATIDAEVAGRLIENALEDCVSAFDGFGREICRVHSNQATDPSNAENVSFQNLEGANQSLIRLFHCDFAAGLTVEEWKVAVRGFQKRHILSHKMGVVDDEYICKTGDSQNVVGRKVNITVEEVRELIHIIDKLARYLDSKLV